jgi:cytochrome c peroxidase
MPKATLITLLLTTVSAPLKAADLTAEQQLGQQLFEDPSLSLHRNQACATCHSLAPANAPQLQASASRSGFVDPDNVLGGTAVSKGSVAGVSGTLNAPTISYARFSPAFHWDAEEGLYIGGQFWNGRAANLVEQAKGPFLNPREMAMPSAWAVVSRLKENPAYRKAFRELYDIELDDIPSRELAPADQRPAAGVQESYERMAQAIAAFEKSRLFSPFSSKFDFVLAGRTRFSAEEQAGLELFKSDKAQCAACHPVEPGVAPGGGVLPPLFTDFSYDNLGVPRNVNIPGNPAPDAGLGGRPEIAAVDAGREEVGKHKVMTVRNVALTPPYMHNGALQTLEQVVHFYNTRDTKQRTCADLNDPGFGEQCWAAAEITANVNKDELGDLGLTAREEAQLVAFMETLTDGYPEWGGDPNVPPGTPSPFAEMPLPPAP